MSVLIIKANKSSMSVVAGNGGSAPKLVYKMKLKRKCITSNLTTPRLLKKTTKKSKKKQQT